MDFLKKFTESENNSQGQGQGQQQNQASSSGNQQEGGSFFDKLAGKVNTAAGGGRESEKDEDYLDKGMYPSLKSARVFEAFGFKLTVLGRSRLCSREVPGWWQARFVIACFRS